MSKNYGSHEHGPLEQGKPEIAGHQLIQNVLEIHCQYSFFSKVLCKIN